MKRKLISAVFVFLFAIQYSCKGVKNVSGTLRKSDSEQGRAYSGSSYTDYTQVPVSTTSPGERANQESRATKPQPRSSAPVVEEAPAGGAYRKDYGRMATGNGEILPAAFVAGSSLSVDANERLVRQYGEMDRMADLVLYELHIVEKRWDQMLGNYKLASQTEREKISADLDKLSADQLKLYRAHVKIYKEGRANWPNVKKDVDATLLSIRGITEK